MLRKPSVVAVSTRWAYSPCVCTERCSCKIVTPPRPCLWSAWTVARKCCEQRSSTVGVACCREVAKAGQVASQRHPCERRFVPPFLSFGCGVVNTMYNGGTRRFAWLGEVCLLLHERCIQWRSQICDTPGHTLCIAYVTAFAYLDVCFKLCLQVLPKTSSRFFHYLCVAMHALLV